MAMLRKRMHTGILVSVVALVSCASTRAQENNPRSIPRHATSSFRTPEQSDLAKDNAGRVAAAAIQVRAVLGMDAGLLVEAAGWVARGARARGEIVEDSRVGGHGIFERFASDIAVW